MNPDDDGAQGNESIPDGLLDAVAAHNHEVNTQNGTPQKADPAKETAPKQTQTKTETESEDDEPSGDNAEGLDSQDFSRQPVPSEAPTDEAPKEEPSKTETQTEAEEDWFSDLPPDPGEFQMEPPKPDDNGQIDPVEYTKYLKAELRHDMKVDAYNDKVISRTFETVEKILPEIKSNAALQSAIRNTFNSTLSPQETVNLAKQFRASYDQTAGENRAAGAQNAKASITVQKNAAVETKGATTKKKDTSRSDNLSKRLAKNDTTAFEELMTNWIDEKKV